MVTKLTRDDMVQLTATQLRVTLPPVPEELVAASIRRAASLRCPIARATLERLVLAALMPLVEVTADDVEGMMDALLASGDLVEARVNTSGGRSLVYLGPPRFIRRRNGDAVLLGVRADAAALVSGELASRLKSIRHLTTIVELTDDEQLLLEEQGLVRVTEARWMDHEPPTDSHAVEHSFRKSLSRQGPSGEVDGLLLLDSARNQRFYRGRWRPLAPTDEGMFVARRSQAYGSDLWSVVSVSGGVTTALIDLPVTVGMRGCDDAWRLQAAIDANRGTPQVAMIDGTGEGRVRVGITLPPPRWLQRRWDLVGVPSSVRLGLVAYEFAPREAREEIEFLKEHLWMKASPAGSEARGE